MWTWQNTREVWESATVVSVMAPLPESHHKASVIYVVTILKQRNLKAAVISVVTLLKQRNLKAAVIAVICIQLLRFQVVVSTPISNWASHWGTLWWQASVRTPTVAALGLKMPCWISLHSHVRNEPDGRHREVYVEYTARPVGGGRLQVTALRENV